MKLIELRRDCLLEIIEFLTFPEIVCLLKICRFFQKFVSSNHQFFQNLFVRRYFLEDSEGLNSWNQICMKIKTEKNSTTSKKFYPFYTDGGTYNDINRYSIQNLVGNHVYCTNLSVENNILVKYCVNDFYPECYNNICDHKISGTVFYIKCIEESIDTHRKELLLINSVEIASPASGYTCPVSTLMVFCSLEKEEDLGIINLFHNTFDVNQVVQIANRMKFNPIVKKLKNFTKVTFDRKENGLAPLLWVKLNSVYQRSKHKFLFKVQRERFARYFYLLLIESEHLRRDTSIDCGKVCPVFKLIRMKD